MLLLQRELMAKTRLEVGASLSNEEIGQLLRDNNLARAKSDALRYLSYRPRSQGEMKTYLQRRGFDPLVLGAVIEELQGQGLIDDAAFARFWKEGRESSRPRSARLVRWELLRKGVDRDIASAATQDLNDAQAAYKSGAKRARQLANLSHAEFRHRLEDHLRRRGFPYTVIRDAIDILWREFHEGLHINLDSDDA